jgi:N-acetylglucosaminyldiphosphoundecaprenol N-acetyl-beta-D-mannosaminyltransferase
VTTLTSPDPSFAPRFRVLDTMVHAVDRSAVGSILGRLLEDGRPHQVVTVNLDFLHKASTIPEFRDVINESDLTVPDGKPLVWMARYLGLSDCDRVTGPDVIELCARLSSERGHRIFLLGGSGGVAEKAARSLIAAYPGVQVCGAYSPPEAGYPFPPHVEDDINRRIREASPDILFVAFGCPKQDFWIHDHMQELHLPLSVGVGGSFAFLTGEIPRAPRAMQRLGLEWSYRLYREPRRLARRYLCNDLPFAVRLAALQLLARFRVVRPVFEVVS